MKKLRCNPIEKIAEKSAKYRIIILIMVLIMCGLSVFLMIQYTNINSDITSYLPDDSKTAEGFAFLRDNFGIQGDLMITVTGVSESTITSCVREINKIKGITTTNWINSPTFAMLSATMPDTYDYLRTVFVREGETQEDTIYAILITMEYGASTSEAYEVVDKAEQLLKSYEIEYAINGSTSMAKSIMEDTINEIGSYLIVGILIVLAILFITTQSFIDPLVLLLTLGVAIIINMGTNFMFKEVSIITYSAASILQLGLSMDYAIFMMHRYRSMRDKGMSAVESTIKAVPYTFSTIAASALTTIGGFIALYFMSFTVGADLANVIIKGVVLSLATVVIVQPCLLIVFDKASTKSKHKYLNLHFRKTTGFTMRHRIVFVTIACLMFIPSLVLQSKLEFNYLKFEAPIENPTQAEIYAQELMNQILISVPIDTSNLEEQYELLDQLNEIDNVEYILGLCAMMDIEDAKSSMRVPQLVAQYVNNGYTLYTIGMSIPVESREASILIEEITTILNDSYETYYITGMAQAVVDFAEITPRDFTIVSIVSILIILLVLLLTLRSIKMTLLLGILIEFGIWINLGISYLTSGNINFMSYIVISAIQLGATIDYAILMSTEYLKNIKKGMHPEKAAFEATTSSAMSILTSASIMCGACLSVYFMSSNLIVGEITMLIARGAIIAAVLILFVLPTVLALSSNIMDKINALRNPSLPENNNTKTIIDEDK